MDNDLKKLVQQIREAQLGQIVEEPSQVEEKDLTIADYASMGSPRDQFPNEIRKPKFEKMQQYIRNLPSTVVADENYVAQPNTKYTYPTKEQELNAQQKFFKSVREAFNGDPSERTIDEIERLRKIIGSK